MPKQENNPQVDEDVTRPDAVQPAEVNEPKAEGSEAEAPKPTEAELVAAVEAVGLRTQQLVAMDADKLVGLTAGAATTTEGLVSPTERDGSQVVVCPNCDRGYPYNVRFAGGTIPCVCNFMIQVQAAS